MHRILCYVSTTNPELSDAEIQELLDFVKQNNRHQNFTGVLMYSDGNFFQVLEGEKKEVSIMFEKIKLDSRHHSMIMIFDREITKSSFTNYDTAFMVVSDQHHNYSALHDYLEHEKSRNPKVFNNISYLTHKFMKLT
ncbi:BLUF domain-containing protein [Aquimarina sp. RZ0]|uniref:BLUF domain-containing protein n=1 Tax=Aquimarina sp. RZ0 TaxID=2607730 RepID=UPI0011F26519|nr:BLUF domain-containing protein [Aquimarina sp. RZ0]KAA1243276.1 BLUF domain-containing protein [Aquimarina sp. RZ0]